MGTRQDEHTPKQRRAIDASLAEAEKGPYFGPFKNGADVERFLKRWKSNGNQEKPKKPR